MATGHMTKVPEWGRPHNFFVNFDMGMESAAANIHTIVPIITYDEGLGAMSAYESNPTNANFLEYAGAKCFPTSKINKIFCKVDFSLTKGAIETDKIVAVNFATMLIHSAFNETGLAADEVSTLDLNEILELQVESTDRQMFPLYNAIDLKDGKTNAQLDLEVGQEGLDTDLEIEGVAFSFNSYYDCLHYMTNGHKLRNVQTGMRHHQLTKQRPTKTLFFQQQSNTKYMNPYAFLGLFVSIFGVGSADQVGKAGEMTDIGHLNVQVTYRYLEFNHEFNHAML